MIPYARNVALTRAKLAKLRPTQFSVGYAEVELKASEWKRLKKKQRDHAIQSHVFPAVLGPGEEFYIVDHHHLGIALIEQDVKECRMTRTAASPAWCGQAAATPKTRRRFPSSCGPTSFDPASKPGGSRNARPRPCARASGSLTRERQGICLAGSARTARRQEDNCQDIYAWRRAPYNAHPSMAR
jgi:hypothetical protein